MTAIAWAIVLHGIFTMTARDTKADGYEYNNAFDVLVFFIAAIMLFYFSFKS